MDDIGGIEYLEEYEDLIIPGSAAEKRTVEDDESSSSIDQDIFESLFDDQSDDESEVLTKKISGQAKQRQERESLDSLDMLVRDLGEQVNPRHEQSSSKNINNSSQLLGITKPITPCLKKSTPNSSSNGPGSSQEKPQKRVMFANLPSVRRRSSTSKTCTQGLQDQHPSSGCKPIESTKTDSNISESSTSTSQRKLNRPPLTIVRPEKIQFKDPVDDPLSFEKNESDLDSLSDISDDSFASLSEIFVTPNNEICLQKNKNHTQSLDSPETSSKSKLNIIQSPPVHISTENLPEKVTIISDTVLTRIDTALLESLATNDSKEAFLKDQKITTESNCKIKQPETGETENTDSLKNNASNPNSSTDATEIYSELEKEFNLSEDCKEETFSHSVSNEEEKSKEILQTQSEQVTEKDKIISEDKIQENEKQNADETMKSPEINSNTSDISQSTSSGKETIKESEELQSTNVMTKEKQSELEDPQKVSVEAKNDVIQTEISKHLDDKNITELKTNTILFSQKNENETLISSQTSKNEARNNKKSTSKKASSAGSVTETQTKEQKSKQTMSKSIEKTNTLAASSQKSKGIAPQNESKGQRSEDLKQNINAVTQSPNKAEQKFEKSSASKPAVESLKKDTKKTNPNQQSDKNKTEKEAESIKEKNYNKSQKTVERKDSSNTKSSSKNQNSHTSTNRSSIPSRNVPGKYQDDDLGKCEKDKQTSHKIENNSNSISRQNSNIQKDTKKPNESVIASLKSEEKIKNTTTSKEKKISSVPQTTPSQVMQNIEKTKASPSKVVSAGKKKDGSKDVVPKKLEDNQKNKDSSKEMVKLSSQTKKDEECRTSTNADSKMGNSKKQKEVILPEDNKKMEKEAGSSKDKSKEQKESYLSKSNSKDQKEAANHEKIISSEPKKHVDIIRTQSDLRKTDQKIEKKDFKVSSEAKSIESSHGEKPSLNDKSTEKTVTRPTTQSSSSLNTSKDNNKRKSVKPPLKRENSTIADNNITKKLKTTSSGNKDTKSNTPDKNNVMLTNQTKEQSLISNPSTSASKCQKSSNINKDDGMSKECKSITDLLQKDEPPKVSNQPKESIESKTVEKEQDKKLAKKSGNESNDLTKSSKTITNNLDKESLLNKLESKSLSKTTQSSTPSTTRANKTPKNNDLATPTTSTTANVKKSKELIKQTENLENNTPTKNVQTSIEQTTSHTSNDKISKMATSSSSLSPSKMDKSAKEANQQTDAAISNAPQRNLKENKKPTTTALAGSIKEKQESEIGASKTKVETNTTPKHTDDQNIEKDESKVTKICISKNDEDITDRECKKKPLLNTEKHSIKKLDTAELDKEPTGQEADSSLQTKQKEQFKKSELKENIEEAKISEQSTDSKNDKKNTLEVIECSEKQNSIHMTKSSLIQEVQSSQTKADSFPNKNEIQTPKTSSVNRIENTITSTENPKETVNTEKQSSIEIMEKNTGTIVSNSRQSQDVSKKIKSRKKVSLSECKNSFETQESIISNLSMEIGTRRNLRKRGSDALAGDDINASVEKDSKKETTQRKSRRGRIADNVDPMTDPFSKKGDTEKNTQKNNLEKQENKKGESTNISSLILESQQDLHLASNIDKVAEEKVPPTVPGKEIIQSLLPQTENENELIPDSKLDSLSTTSVESTVFSGFVDSPVTVCNNEDLDESISTNNLTTNSAKEENLVENPSFSPKRLRTSPSKPATSVVITFKEWLATKNSGQSAPEQGMAHKDNNKTLIDTTVAKDNPSVNVSEEYEAREHSNKVVSTENPESADHTLINPKPHHKKKKKEIDVLRESMSKEMLESGIDKLIESHSSSPHCLTKRSIAAAINKNRVVTRKHPESAQEKPSRHVKRTSPNRSSGIQAPAIGRNVSSPNITAIANVTKISSNKKPSRIIQKNLRHLPKPIALPLKCRKLRILLNRSIVDSYLKNIKEEISNATSSLKEQHLVKVGKKRKAVVQPGGPIAKKATISTTLDQSSATNISTETPLKPSAEQEKTGQLQAQSHTARCSTSNKGKANKASPRSGSISTTSPSTGTAAEPKDLLQPSISSPLKTNSKSIPVESDLLMPISVAPTLITPTDNSRRAKSKRSGAFTNTTPITTISNSGKAPTTPSLTLPAPIQTQALQIKPPTSVQESTSTLQSNVAPKTECVDEYDSTYSSETQQVVGANKKSLSSFAPSTDVVSPSPSVDTRAQSSTLPNAVPLVISGATSHSLPPIVIDNAGTRIYSFLHPTKYNNSHGYVMLDYCCPNLDGPMTAIDPTRRHAKVDAAVRELPAYITMETRLVTRAELEADSNALPASIRHKVQRITGGQTIPPKVMSNPTVASSLTTSVGLTSTNVTTTTTAAPKATTASVSAVTTSSSSNMSAPLTMPASVSALQKQLPATTTLTPKTLTGNMNSATYKTTSGNTNPTTVVPVIAPIATITPTSVADMRAKLRNNLKKYDVLLKKHYPRISLLTFAQRQEIVESLVNATQLLPRDIETATRLMQEYVTHMALKTATKPQTTSDMSNHTAPAGASAGLRNVSTTAVSSNVTTGASGAAIQQAPPITTRAHSKRNATSSNLQQRSVPIYNSDKTIIGYQVQMVPPANTKTIASITNSSSFTTSTRKFTKNNASMTASTSTTTTRRSGVFVIDKMNMSAPASNLMTITRESTPRTLYQKPDIRTPTSVTTVVHTPQASSTPISSSGSVVTRSGGISSKTSRGVPIRQLPPRATTMKMHSPATTTTRVGTNTTQASPLPRLPTLTRNPHLPPLSSNQLISAPNTRSVPVGIEQSTFQKRLTRKTAAATSSLTELLVVSHDFDGNPLPATDESILPDESNTASTALIKSEKPEEF